MTEAQWRYVVVRVDKYLGDYTGRYLAWSVADRQQANRCVTGKYDGQQDAQAEADRLEAADTGVPSYTVLRPIVR